MNPKHSSPENELDEPLNAAMDDMRDPEVASAMCAEEALNDLTARRKDTMSEEALAWAAWHPVKGFGPTPNACWDIDEAINDAKCQSILDDSPDWIAVRVEIRRQNTPSTLTTDERG